MVASREAAVLFSGGKDSTYTIQLLRAEGYSVSCLVTLYSQDKESYMLHTSNIELARLSAQALEIPIVTGETLGRKEEELEDIKKVIANGMKEYGFDTLACGGIASNYQKTRVEKIASELGLKPKAPLWGLDQKNYLRSLVNAHYRFVLTSVSAAGLDETWLGREIDSESSAEELIRLSEKFKFNAALEGGEGESLVLECPLFLKEKIVVKESRKIWNGYTGLLEITKAGIERKGV